MIKQTKLSKQIYGAFSFPLRSASFAIALLLFNLTASAHPGHGFSDHGWGHVFTSPDHLLVVAGMGAVTVWLARWLKDQKLRMGVRMVGGFAAAISLIGWLTH
jgi:hypothetical protein